MDLSHLPVRAPCALARGQEFPSVALMPLEQVTIEHYRSLREVRLPLAAVTVLVGANGCGKTSCYRALRLLHAAAAGRLAETFLEEGGMPSALWAGPRRRKEEVRLRVAAQWNDGSVSVACGLPAPSHYGYPPLPSAFQLDPEVKEEVIAIRVPGIARPVVLCDRRHRAVSVRGEDHRRVLLTTPLDLAESVLSQLSDPSRYPELALVRANLLDWRFYHHFRVDAASPLREERLAVRAPVLAGDGLNLAAVLQTIHEIGHEDEVQQAIAAAFPGSRLEITHDHGRFGVTLQQPGSKRAYTARELSDGTLRYLCLIAALLTPRPPLLMAFNEPEASLHAELLGPLAALLLRASTRSQILIATHATVLADALAAAGAVVVRLVKRDGETLVDTAGAP